MSARRMLVTARSESLSLTETLERPNRALFTRAGETAGPYEPGVARWRALRARAH